MAHSDLCGVGIQDDLSSIFLRIVRTKPGGVICPRSTGGRRVKVWCD